MGQKPKIVSSGNSKKQYVAHKHPLIKKPCSKSGCNNTVTVTSKSKESECWACRGMETHKTKKMAVPKPARPSEQEKNPT